MDLPNVDKKLAEARFFLSKMSEQEKRAFGDKEPFDFYLSAFLSAARTVDYRLRHEQMTLYPPWRTNTWDTLISPAEKGLMKYLADERAAEVHQSGSARVQKTEDIPVGDSYSDSSGTLYVFAPPGTPPAIVHKPAYFFTIDGTDRKATETCAKYLGLLDRMVAKFKADNP
jgi:hypothetical protein